MKNTILFLISFFMYLSVSAQYDYIRGKTLVRTFDQSSSEIEGSPYFNEYFALGYVHVKGKEPLQVFLRYNVFKEEIEIRIQSDSQKTYVIPRNSNIQYTIGEKNHFLLDKIYFEEEAIYGYFIEYYNKDNLRFVMKPVAKFIPAKEADTGYEEDEPAEYVVMTEYYLIFPDGKVEKIRLKNRIIRKVFESKTSKKYLKDHDINTAQDLVAFLEYRRTL